MSEHTISVKLENKAGALVRVSQLFARRGYNIQSLAVGPTERDDISCLTLRVDCSEHSLEQIEKQIHKLVDVLRVTELAAGEAVERELMLVKVRSDGDNRARIMEIADVFRVNVVDVTHGTLTLEASGKPEKLEALLGMLRDFGVVELSRTGRVALARGDRSIKDRTLKVANDA